MPLPILAGVSALGSLFGGGGGGGGPVTSATGPQNVVFGSVNFKSPGAGDRGKSAGGSDPASTYAASSGESPAWLMPVALGALVLGAAFIGVQILKKR